jgi:hypothetical protein
VFTSRFYVYEASGRLESTKGSSMSATRSLVSVLAVAVAALPLSQGASHTAQAAPVDLFLSEYVEGSSNNKAIEIYNGTSDPIDLTGYTLALYSNGSPRVSQSTALTGTLAPGDVFVMANPSAVPAILAVADATSSSVINWNGDDAIVLSNGTTVVDSFGEVGVRPTSEWTGGGQDDTLRRKPTVCAGDTNPSDPFDASIEWDTFPVDTFGGLGVHTSDCGGGGGGDPLTVDCGATLVTDVGVAASTTVSALDGDDIVAAMAVTADDVTPTGSLVAGTFTPSSALGEPATLVVELSDAADAGVYTATIEATNGNGETATCAVAIQVLGTVAIHDVQGSGAASPLVGAVVSVEGVVVGDFQDGVGADGDLNGFYVQEEDADADADPATSEGIFVADGNTPAVDVANGDLVRVTGVVGEVGGATRITAPGGVTVVSSGNPAPTPAAVTLPVTALTDFEAFEGMSVTFPQDLVISEYFNFDRFGEIVLTSERRLTPTAVVEPGPAAIAAAQAAVLDRITLDDGRSTQNPDPAIHPNGDEFDLDNLFRGGDTVGDVTGVMDFAFGLYRVHPTQGADYSSVNERPAAPEPVGGRLQVANFNVLNYFTTLDDGVNDICGPLANQECRGADNAVELERQRAKIVAAIAAIDADVVGLIEIENGTTDGPTADLVAGLNEVAGAGTYDYVATGAIGGDAIRVAIVYKPASVTPSGAFAVLDSSVDPRFVDTLSRPALAQTFEENATGGAFTVAVNHLKSKGSACPGDPDTGDGSGNCNGTRTMAAAALADWLATDPTGSGDPDVMIVGDLNSYDKEAPIDVLRAAGYRDLAFDLIGEDAYSFVFDGQIGYLDYAMANTSLAPQVTGVTEWHINADEPDLIDYDTSFKQPAQDAIYAPDPYRSSDHDPVIVGLDLSVSARTTTERARDVVAAIEPRNRREAAALERALDSIDDSLDPDLWAGDDHLNGQRGKRVFDEARRAVRELDGIPGADEAIDLLVAADRGLAEGAIDIALATGGDERDIARAGDDLARGDDDADRGRPEQAIDRYGKAWSHAIDAVEDARFATFNASLNRASAGALRTELSSPGSAQPATIAEIVQRTRPEVLLINEIDEDPDGVAAALFQENYLSVGQNGADPIEYPFRYVASSNTGIPSGLDLDNSGSVGGPNDAFGFGFFPGQFGMAVYSMHPIDVDGIRTFQNFLWKDMPGNRIPAGFYSPEELDVFRLSSKSHWDVPIWVGDRLVHFLASHPTPPVFDGPEDRNGTRNFDEIRFWADYVSGGSRASYIYDDSGGTGGLRPSDRFVIAGDQNSDPLDGDSIPGAIQQLLDHPRVNTKVTPSSPGGTEQAALQGGANATHLSDPAFDTADFADTTPGNLRADYVLPSRNTRIDAAAVFWPATSDPLFRLTGTFPFPSSDHRLVWVDVDP